MAVVIFACSRNPSGFHRQPGRLARVYLATACRLESEPIRPLKLEALNHESHVRLMPEVPGR